MPDLGAELLESRRSVLYEDLVFAVGDIIIITVILCFGLLRGKQAGNKGKQQQIQILLHRISGFVLFFFLAILR